MVSYPISSELFDRETVERMMSSPTGRQFVTALLETCGIYRQSYSPGQPSDATFFREGERSVGLRVFAAVQMHASGNYHRALEERRVRLEGSKPSVDDDGSAE